MNLKARNTPPKLVNLTPIQVQYLKDERHRFYINPSGRRSRKTLIAKRKTLLAALRNPNTNYFCGAPTHAQAKNIYWNDLKRDTYYFTQSRSETEMKVILKNGSMIQVIGLDKPERVEGMPWHGCHITEIGNVKETAWGENIRPVLSDTNGWAILDGVPEGINFLYDLALYACDGALPKTQPKIGAFAESKNDPQWCYYHWFSSDVLTQEEIYAAKMQLDERTFRQEYEGSFESYAGLAYWAFSEKNLDLSLEYNKGETVHIGMDFNVDPMTASFHHIRGDNIYQFGEAYLNHSNTYEMIEHIKQLFPIEDCIIYPDSTGASMSSNATRSDIELLQKAGFKVRALSANPHQKDRINAVNSKMRAGDGKSHYFVNPKNCPKIINDWNKVMTTADGRLDKTQEKSGLVHISDSVGYMINYLFPIRKSTFGSQTI